MNEFWHWPDHIIRKRESRRLREEHNARMNERAQLIEALQNLANDWERCNGPIAGGHEAKAILEKVSKT